MSDDDPFGLADRDRTQVARPRPGGKPGGDGAAPSGAAAWAGGAGRAFAAAPAAGGALPRGTPGRGPLVELAFGILALVPTLRSRTPPSDPEQLRAQLERELQRFSDAAQAQGQDQRLVAVGHYVLCAFIDDIVLNTPWGAHGTWRSRSLAGTLHHDVGGGQRVFEYLEQAKKAPERSRPVLELIHVCLALGFEGSYRLAPHGAAQLQQIRAELAGLLARQDGEPQPELAAHWRGVEAAHVPIVQRIPLWVFGTGTLAVLVLVYVAFALRLGGLGERLDTLVMGLPPINPVGIVRQAVAVTISPPLPPATAIEPSLRNCLPEPAKSRPDSVLEDLEKVRVRLPNAGLFRSGSADLEASVEPVLLCLAGVLAGAEGEITVLGHSDNVPIRTARFPSNWELSKARAEAVAVVLQEVITPKDRLAVEGRSDTEPVAPNATEDGRGRNRRVDILLLK